MSIVETKGGKVEGAARQGHVAFLNVPFAAAPAGEKRWHAPEPALSWSGVRKADRIGPISLQPTFPSPIPGLTAEGEQSEDCLNLNIYTPAADGKKRPVLYWIHGGAFVLGSGSGALYDGGPLAVRGDVVVVTINYRLGALGFLDLSAILPGATANAGLLDQVAGLKWVRDNIAAFGGDPGNVTIFGESAGSMSVSALLAMPSAKGLYKRAILQSGVSRGADKKAAAAFAEKFVAAAGLTKETASELYKLPADKILAAQMMAQAQAGAGAGQVMGPVIDGAVLPQGAGDAAKAGGVKDIDLLIGSTRDEFKLFAPRPRQPLDDAALPMMAKMALRNAADADLPKVVDFYRKSRQAKNLPSTNHDVFDAIQSDVMFRIGSVRLAAAQSAHRNTYLYMFNFTSPTMPDFGACHALEIPYVFGTLGAHPMADSSANSQKLRDTMMDAWIAFAKTGNPSTPALPWPAYTAAERATMVFDVASGPQNDPHGDEREVIEAHIEGVGI